MTTVRLTEELLGQCLSRGTTELLLSSQGPVPYRELVIAEAIEDLGIRETRSNRGERIDAIHRLAGSDPSDAYAWCAEAIYAWHEEAARVAGGHTTCPRTPSAMRQWLRGRKAGEAWRADDTRPLQAGDVFYRVRRGRNVKNVWDGHSRKGHTGLIVSVRGDVLDTIEGNTDGSGSREGDGVYRRVLSRYDRHLVGFARYGVVT